MVCLRPQGGGYTLCYKPAIPDCCDAFANVTKACHPRHTVPFPYGLFNDEAQSYGLGITPQIGVMTKGNVVTNGKTMPFCKGLGSRRGRYLKINALR